MNSPYKKIVTYDYETGGLSYKFNSITEIALVAIDMKTLEIIDEDSFLIKPRLDLRNREEDPKKESKVLFKALARKDKETNIKTLEFGGEKLTLKNLEPLIEKIEEFNIEYLEKRGSIIPYEVYDVLSRSKFKDITNLYFDMCYNPIALEITKISKKLLVSEGIEFEEAYKRKKAFLEKHTAGNNKPIVAGHNIGSLPKRIIKGKTLEPDGFDNLYAQKFFEDNGDDFFACINPLILDTLKLARLAFFSMPSYNLGTVCNELGLTLKNAHRALPDTIMNAKMIIKLLQNLRGEGTSESIYKREEIKIDQIWKQ